jgi:hypothetical protein
MKRLLKSYKFYCALLGTVAVITSHKMGIESDAILLGIIGLWTAVIGGQAWKDATKINNGE